MPENLACSLEIFCTDKVGRRHGKPAAAAEQNPPNIHVHVDIRPTDAAALTPRLPTIAESMNCISTDESCAIIAGKLIMPASLACCPKVIASPPRSIPRRVSLLNLSI